jgi:alpha-beta hydrolase superfamily lysophospholipase
MADEPRIESFQSSRGDRLTEYWWPTENAKAAIFLIHGYGEYAGRYQHLADDLATHGYSLYAFDLSGHGRSDGERGFINTFDDYVADTDAALKRFDEVRKELPAFHMGHSMGGLVLALYLNVHTLETNGLIFSSPFLKMAVEVSPLLQKLSGIIAAILPQLPMGDVESVAISRDIEEVKKYQDDPLVFHDKVVARTGARMIRATAFAREIVSNIKEPLLIFHGTDDRLAAFEGGEWLYEQAASEDKTFHVYREGYHELFNDLDKNRFYNELTAWLDEHMTEQEKKT